MKIDAQYNQPMFEFKYVMRTGMRMGVELKLKS